MIAFVTGTVAEITPDQIVLDTGSLGYHVRVSPTTAAKIAGIGERVKLYTYTCVREDAFLLYGFLRKDELEIFQKLLSVNGIGPKGALGILSAMDVDALRFAIITEDVAAICKAPGIGKKTAERLVLDLKDKLLKDSSYAEQNPSLPPLAIQGSDQMKEAILALTALGYSAPESQKAIRRIAGADQKDAGVILKEALKYLS
jgi:Holliday junction DNA helicase RuvA